DHEQVVNAAVGAAVRVAFESNFEHRAIGTDEAREAIARSELVGGFDLWIELRTRSADGRKSVATAAGIGIESGTEAGIGIRRSVADKREFLEGITPFLKETVLASSKAFQRFTCGRRAGAHPGIADTAAGSSKLLRESCRREDEL